MIAGLISCAVGCGKQASSSLPQPSNGITPAPKQAVMPTTPDNLVMTQKVVTDEHGTRTITVLVPVSSGEPIKSLPKEKAPKPKEKRE